MPPMAKTPSAAAAMSGALLRGATGWGVLVTSIAGVLVVTLPPVVPRPDSAGSVAATVRARPKPSPGSAPPDSTPSRRLGAAPPMAASSAWRNSPARAKRCVVAIARARWNTASTSSGTESPSPRGVGRAAGLLAA